MPDRFVRAYTRPNTCHYYLHGCRYVAAEQIGAPHLAEAIQHRLRVASEG